MVVKKEKEVFSNTYIYRFLFYFIAPKDTEKKDINQVAPF
jgi:hypothetical protein